MHIYLKLWSCCQFSLRHDNLIHNWRHLCHRMGWCIGNAFFYLWSVHRLSWGVSFLHEDFRVSPSIWLRPCLPNSLHFIIFINHPTTRSCVVWLTNSIITQSTNHDTGVFLSGRRRSFLCLSALKPDASLPYRDCLGGITVQIVKLA
jgi:hypothetical protein